MKQETQQLPAKRSSTTISVRQLTKNYYLGRTVVPALRGINLEVARDEFVALMGPSGSGKSTLMNILGCLDKPTSGSYLLDGEPVSQMSTNQLADVRNHKIGFVFQGFNLLPWMTAQENVELPLLYSDIQAQDRRRQALEALSLLGLGSRAEHRPMELSGGQQQRVAIARALVTRPRLLLADEPTGNVDSQTGIQIMTILQKLNARGLTIILVTHDPNIASYCQRQVKFLDGRIVDSHTILPLQAKELLVQRYVTAVSPVINTNGQLVFGSQNWQTTVQGVYPSYQQIASWQVQEGSFISQSDEQGGTNLAVVGQTVVQNLFPAGTDPVGQQIRINNQQFTVVGTLVAKGSTGFGANADDVVFIPMSTAQQRLSGSQYVNSIVLTANSSATVNSVQNAAQQLLQQRHRITNPALDDFTIQNASQLLSTVQASNQSLTILLVSVAAISLVVGGIGIMNIMLVSVTERTREIGIRIAVGARPRDVMTQFLIEAFILSAFGGIIGMLLGPVGAIILSKTNGYPFVLDPLSILLAFGVSALVGVIFGFYPAQRAALMDPIMALRTE